MLIILLVRSFITEGKYDLWFVFSFGLLLSFLSGFPLGGLSFIYLLLQAVVKVVKKTQFAQHWIIVLPLISTLIIFDKMAENFMFGAGFNLRSSILDIILILPIYFTVRFWEERFIPAKEVKLKIGK